VAPVAQDSSDAETSVPSPATDGTPRTATYPEATLIDVQASTGASYACSAVLVAPRVVLTAGHCVDGMVLWDAYVGGVHATSSRGETYDWSESGATMVNPGHHDVGLVYLDQPVFVPVYPTISAAAVPDGTVVDDVGRVGGGRQPHAFFGAPVTVSTGAAVGYPYDYYGSAVIQHGDSGGPVFLPSTHTLVAINSGANAAMEVLARVDLVATWIAERVAASGSGDAHTDAGGDATAMPDAAATQASAVGQNGDTPAQVGATPLPGGAMIAAGWTAP